MEKNENIHPIMSNPTVEFEYMDLKPRKALKDEEKFKTVLADKIPKILILGRAHDQGDCFFDALAQCINQINKTNVNTDKYLRLQCHDFYGKNKDLVDKWNTSEFADIDSRKDEYYLVQYTVDECEEYFHGRTPIWGRPNVEGKILCQQLNLEGICIIEMLEDPETKQPVLSFHLANKDSYKSISEEEAQDWLKKANIPKLVVGQNSLHFVPLLNISELSRKPITIELSEHSQINSNTNIIVDDNLAASHSDSDSDKQTQNKSIIRNLVFEGGGIKGLAYAGALDVLIEKGHLKTVDNVAGASAGAITALLLGLGYSADEIKELLDTDFSKFADGKPIKRAVDLLNQYGIHPGNKVRKWLADIIEKKLGKSDATFADLFTRIARQGNPEVDAKFRQVFMIGSNLTTREEEIFSYYTTPHMPLVEAVRISMSIPFYFIPCKYTQTQLNAWFRQGEGHRKDNIASDLYVDGGLIENYPVRLFDTGYPNIETLGLRVDSAAEIAQLREGKAPKREAIKNIGEFALAVVSAAMSAQQRGQEQENFRTIYIDTGKVGTTQFSLNDDEKQYLLTQGRSAALNFFTVWFNNATPKTGLEQVLDKNRHEKYDRYHIYQHASTIHFVPGQSRAQFIFDLPQDREWTKFHEKIEGYYNRLCKQPWVTSIQHYRSADDKQHLLVINLNQALQKELANWLVKQAKEPIAHPVSLDYRTLVRERLGQMQPRWMMLQDPQRLLQVRLAQTIETGHVENILKLLHEQVRLDYRDDRGNNYLHLLAKTGRATLVETLVQKNIPINGLNNFRDTPLHYAVSVETMANDPNADMVKALLKFGADVNMRNVQGQTPLMIAASCNYVAAVKLLLAHNADLTFRGFEGKTALELAEQNQCQEVIALLRAVQPPEHAAVYYP